MSNCLVTKLKSYIDSEIPVLNKLTFYTPNYNVGPETDVPLYRCVVRNDVSCIATASEQFNNNQNVININANTNINLYPKIYVDNLNHVTINNFYNIRLFEIRELFVRGTRSDSNINSIYETDKKSVNVKKSKN